MKKAKKTNKKKTNNGSYILALIFAVAVFVVSIVCMSANGMSDDVQNPPPSTTAKKTNTVATETKGVSVTESITTEPVTTEPVTTESVTTEPVTTEPITTEPVTTEPLTTEPVTTQLPETTEEPITTQTPETTTGPVDTTDSPVTTNSGETTNPGPITDEPIYPMPERPAVEDSYFDDVLFVGDSRTQGIQLYGNMKNATYYADQGLNVTTAMQRNFINESGEMLTIVDAIKRHPEFKKIYICFGVNEYWMLSSTYKHNYEILVDAIKAAAAPDAKIFIYSVFPLADGLANSEYGLNNDKMAEFNAISLEIAREKGLYYIDVSEAFLKPDGRRYLDSNDSSDGIHLNVQGTLKLCNYIRTHSRYYQ